MRTPTIVGCLALVLSTAATACGPGRTDPVHPAHSAGDGTAEPSPTHGDGGTPAQGDRTASFEASAAAPLPPIDPASCPRTLDGLEEHEALLAAAETLLRAHYGVGERTEVVCDGHAFRGIEAGEGRALIAMAFGTLRFELWRERMLQTPEWETLHARAMAGLAECMRAEYEKCMACFDDPQEARAECEPILELAGSGESQEEYGCTLDYEGAPPQGPGCCLCDTLAAATFTARLGPDGEPDVGTLELLGEGTVLPHRCNPGWNIGPFDVADLDGDGAFELFFEVGQDEHDGEPYQVEPYDVVVLRPDGTVQHRLSYAGISELVPAAESAPPRGTWYRFEDHDGDGRPDLVVQTFELAAEGCSARQDWFPIALDENGSWIDNPACRPVYDDYGYGGCDYD
ncbi:MAG: hypothetical protein JXB32_12530, partial [Deltaproteobacteria bacterium]|nr:hypothetical protein [Deltaproteobacteria bacterium]